MEQSEKHFNTLLFCGFEKSTKNKVHRGLRGSSPLDTSNRIYPVEFLSEATSFPQDKQSTVVKRCIFAPFEKGSEDTT